MELIRWIAELECGIDTRLVNGLLDWASRERSLALRTANALAASLVGDPSGRVTARTFDLHHGLLVLVADITGTPPSAPAATPRPRSCTPPRSDAACPPRTAPDWRRRPCRASCRGYRRSGCASPSPRPP